MEEEEDQELGSVTFAATLKAADKHINPDSQFPKFSSLPLELRIAIWQSFLPVPEDEPGAIFLQRHSYTWANHDGEVTVPTGDEVPIRMTTTCAALLHVNKESRYHVLRWADSLGYKLCFRVLDRDLYHLYDLSQMREAVFDYNCTEDSERKLAIIPVHGPIFTRPWNPDKDVLDIVYSSDHSGFPNEWAERYVAGEKLGGVQHLAISIEDLKGYLASKWFYQLLGAMPDLKTLSLDYQPLGEEDGETFRGQTVELAAVGDPWAAFDGRKQPDKKNSRRRPSADCRWEAIDPELEDIADFNNNLNFKDKLLEGFLNENNWPQGGGAYEHYKDEDGNGPNIWLIGVYDYLKPRLIPERKAKVLESLPPWIWDHDKGEFAFESRAFQPVEVRGYDDVCGGFIIKCLDHYGL
ncbi:hypothetical protein CC79DRAFT_1398898 [Sarocladium strictum]